MPMTDHERYLFDLNGFLVIRSVLSDDLLTDLLAEVAAAGVDDALDRHGYLHAGFPREYYDDGGWTGDGGYRYVSDSYLLDWGPTVRSLVAHPRVAPYLAELVGEAYRLDHAYGVFSRGPTASHDLHNGGTPFDPSQAYTFRDGRMHNSMVVVQFALTPVGPGEGGFCCIPGSHKANLPLPPDVASLDALDPQWSPHVHQVPLAAGDVLVFTEAVTHGAWPWHGRSDRKALLLKYCQGGLQWEKDSPFVTAGHRWSAAEERVLASPYVGGRPAVGAR